MASKTSEVLRHLKENGSITSNEAWELFGATRLSAIIFTLRKRGYDIETVPVDMIDRYGHSVTYAKYVLHADETARNLFEMASGGSVPALREIQKALAGK